jgi:hypothetical protein
MCRVDAGDDDRQADDEDQAPGDQTERAQPRLTIERSCELELVVLIDRPSCNQHVEPIAHFKMLVTMSRQ